MYILKPEMAQELKQTDSEIYIQSPKFLHDSKFIATIGDICTIKIIEEIRAPDLIIVDYKTKRSLNLNDKQMNVIKKIDCNTVQVINKAGTISEELYDEIERAIINGEKTMIVVDGEEDLATLPVIIHSQLGAKVIYGMPDKGMVVVDVNQQTKERANKLLERMLVK